MYRISPKPEGLPSVSKLEVGDSRDQALMPGGVEEELRAELITGKACDPIVCEFRERTQRLIIVALDNNIAGQKANLRAKCQLATVKDRSLAEMRIRQRVAVLANQWQAIVGVCMTHTDVCQVNRLAITADACNSCNLRMR